MTPTIGQMLAAQGGPKVPQDVSVVATVGIGPRSEEGFGLPAELEVDLPGLGADDATRNNIDVKLRLKR